MVAARLSERWFAILPIALVYLLCMSSWVIITGDGRTPHLPFHAERAVSRPDISSEKLISDAFSEDGRIGDRDIGGFMAVRDLNVHIATVKAIEGPNSSRTRYPFISHFGLQYDAFKGLSHWNNGRVSLLAAQIGAMLGMSVVVAMLFLWVWKQYSLFHAIFATSAFFAPLMLERAASGYWQIYLCFLPFLAMLWLYPKGTSSSRFGFIAAIVAVLVAIKCLTGYEYISAVALSAAIPIFYYEILDAGGRLSNAWKRVFVRSAIIGFAAIVGFSIAAFFHVAKATALFGTWKAGIDALIIPATYSSIGSDTGIRSDALPTLKNIVRHGIFTFGMYNAPVNAALLALLGFGAFSILRKGDDSWATARLRALAWTTLFALAGSLSWFFLAIRHSMIHPHINWVTLYIVFIPVAALLGAEMMSLGGGRSVTRRPAAG